MRFLCLLAFAAALHAQTKALVDFEMMTWPEVKKALEQGKTTALVYNGGTEQRGPHAVLGGHTLMAHAIAPMIARKLGNALVAPVLPFSVNPAGGVDPKMPGGMKCAIGAPRPPSKSVTIVLRSRMALNARRTWTLSNGGLS